MPVMLHKRNIIVGEAQQCALLVHECAAWQKWLSIVIYENCT